jgi:hypothetical protein
MGNSCVKNYNKIKPIEIVDNSILKWKSTKKIGYYHWWPLCEKQENDVTNNLYADGNALDKYDKLFGTMSVQYQKENYYISNNSTRLDKSWAGFCNYGAIMSSLYSYPKYDVIVKHKNKLITFTPRDIEQLIIIACKNTIKPNISLFFGIRNNDDSNKSKEEPLPSELLNILDIMCKNDRPFIMDIDHEQQVWNYAYDEVVVCKYNSCPLPHKIPKGKTDYYNFIINSNAYPEQNQNLWGYVNTIYDNSGYICEKNEKWISESHPDFIWSKYPIDKPWEGKCIINPEVNARIIYEIYKLSLSSYSNTLIIN